MGDRVAIIGGSTAGRDHFPFPVVDMTHETGDGTARPFAVNLLQMAEVSFKVRKWHVEWGITFDMRTTLIDSSHPEFGYNYRNGTASVAFNFEPKITPLNSLDADPLDVASYDFTSLVPITRESELVLARFAVAILGELNFDGSFSEIGDVPIGITDVSSSVDYVDVEALYSGSVLGQFSLTMDVCGAPGIFGGFYNGWDGVNFRPSVAASFHAEASGSSDIGELGEPNFPFSIDESYLDLSLAGDELIAPIYSDSDTASTVAGMKLYAFGCVITPLVYWPYAARDGSPIYSTATGAPLRDPLS